MRKENPYYDLILVESKAPTSEKIISWLLCISGPSPGTLKLCEDSLTALVDSQLYMIGCQWWTGTQLHTDGEMQIHPRPEARIHSDT